MEDISIRKDILVSMQKALWGMIYPSIRAIAVGFEKKQRLTVIYYLDREPNEEDYESISLVTTEVCADIGFMEVEEICEFSNERFNKLNSLNSWVYMRKEH